MVTLCAKNRILQSITYKFGNKFGLLPNLYYFVPKIK